jgi:hypothetical protein
LFLLSKEYFGIDLLHTLKGLYDFIFILTLTRVYKTQKINNKKKKKKSAQAPRPLFLGRIVT